MGIGVVCNQGGQKCEERSTSYVVTTYLYGFQLARSVDLMSEEYGVYLAFSPRCYLTPDLPIQQLGSDYTQHLPMPLDTSCHHDLKIVRQSNSIRFK
jgi:hypothetical protein